ncbi:hypothetical protein MKW92_005991 [Papaver armeniacum]|nr:hypothetical protein MKW92_005991 [Papaver armeniacum]
MIVTASAELSDIEFGRIIHCFGLKFGLLRGYVAIGSSFVYMYCKCNELRDAENMFDEMTVRDAVSWTLINGYVQNDEFEKGLDCFREMHKVGVGDGEKPNVRTIDGGLKACGNLGYVLSGRCIHGYMVKAGNGYSQFCGTTEEAASSFLELDDKDLISMTTIIGVYARKGRIHECLDLFWAVQKSEIDPDEIIISCILSGLGNSKMVSEGKAFHGMIIRRGFKLSKMVISSLISMYSKFGCLNIAENLFDRLFERDVESWNHMISGYSKLGLETKCFELFREMQQLRVEANKDSLVLVLSSCSESESALIGRSVHCYAIKNGKDANISVANSLVGMYGRCKNLTAANRLFRRVQKDIVTWNTLITAYTHSGHSNEAISLFEQMISADVKPNSVTLKTHGKRVHSYIKEMGLEFDLSLVTSLLSREIFDSMPKRDVISWNVMISGYGIHGDANAAVELFQQMEDSCVRPNGLSFLAVLLACTHAGLVEAGKDIFSRMERYAIQPTLKHYACMVDLLGRAGYLHEAENLVLSMPIVPDGGVWGSLLGCCRTHNDVEMAERVAKRAIESRVLGNVGKSRESRESERRYE